MNAIVRPSYGGPQRRRSDLQLSLHPDMVRIYALYVVPLAMVPSVSLLYCWQLHHATVMPGTGLVEVSTAAALLFLASLLMLPLMAAYVQARRGPGQVARALDRATVLCAVAPALLWLTPLMLLVPSLAAWGLVTAMGATGMLQYLGTYSLFQVESPDQRRQMCWSVVAISVGVWLGLITLALWVWGVPPG